MRSVLTCYIPFLSFRLQHSAVLSTMMAPLFSGRIDLSRRLTLPTYSRTRCFPRGSASVLAAFPQLPFISTTRSLVESFFFPLFPMSWPVALYELTSPLTRLQVRLSLFRLFGSTILVSQIFLRSARRTFPEPNRLTQLFVVYCSTF